MTSEERRRFCRIPFHLDAEVTCAGNRYSLALLDISLKGVMVGRPADVELHNGTLCQVRIPLGTEVWIEMEGEVAHLCPERIGIKCTAIELESITALRRLVELNLGDEWLLQREFDALLEG
ncbi:MAG: PilZ domain-containing protein [Sulfuricella sp.]|nr:PilZ domain-containing protein [Sulfuricella sp.]